MREINFFLHNKCELEDPVSKASEIERMWKSFLRYENKISKFCMALIMEGINWTEEE